MNTLDWIHLITAIVPGLITAVAIVVSTRDSIRVLNESFKELRSVIDRQSERHERSEKETNEKVAALTIEVGLLKYAMGVEASIPKTGC